MIQSVDAVVFKIQKINMVKNKNLLPISVLSSIYSLIRSSKLFSVLLNYN
jgi:hypothetical protein